MRRLRSSEDLIWAYCAHRASRWISPGRSIRTQPCVGSVSRRLRSDTGWLRTDLRRPAMKTGQKLGQKNREHFKNLLQKCYPFEQFTCSKTNGFSIWFFIEPSGLKTEPMLGRVIWFWLRPSSLGGPNRTSSSWNTERVQLKGSPWNASRKNPLNETLKS